MKLEDICPICSSVKDGVLKYIIDTHYIITPKFITNRYYLHLLCSFVLSFFAVWFLIEFAHLAETPIWFQLFVGGFGAFAVNFVREMVYEELYGAQFDWTDINFGSYGGILGALLAIFIF
jgi:hypothetical protein